LPKGACTVSITKRDRQESKLPPIELKLEITGNEHFELEYDQQLSQLRVLPTPPFQPQGMELLPVDRERNQKDDQWFLAHAASIDRVLFQVQRLGTLSSNWAHIRRPAFAAASVRELNATRPAKYMLADVDYAPTYPPVLEFPLPVQGLGKQIQFDLWHSDTFPDALGKRVVVNRSETKPLGFSNSSVEWLKEKNTIVVRLDSVDTNRAFVICRGAMSSKRTYLSATQTTKAEEIHQIEVDAESESATLQILFEEDLAEATKGIQPAVEHRSLVYTLSN
jgi:hypothetical protein